jgi:hypothetical protein
VDNAGSLDPKDWSTNKKKPRASKTARSSWVAARATVRVAKAVELEEETLMEEAPRLGSHSSTFQLNLSRV